jgi:hypothetical protein
VVPDIIQDAVLSFIHRDDDCHIWYQSIFNIEQMGLAKIQFEGQFLAEILRKRYNQGICLAVDAKLCQSRL